MAIVEKTSNKLKLRFFPWYCWAVTIVCSVFFFPTYFAVFLETVPVKTLRCQRVESQQINCESKDLTFRPFPSQTVVIENLKAVKSNRIINHNHQLDKQELVLLTKQEKFVFVSKRIFNPESPETNISNIESRISRFINNPQEQYFYLDTGNSQFQWFLLTALIGIVIFLILFCENRISEFDNNRSLLTIKRQWLFLFSRTKTYPLTDIKSVEVERMYMSNRRHTSYRITLFLTYGKKLPLSTYYANTFKYKGVLLEQANALSQFLSTSRKS
ncbi:MAG: hypothetical protein MJK14_21380 [Rivularia sp. ALOHA_DT_140]|nr:hypothetical protein [Rivularia sp. ALOHA_DT_140]